MLDGRRERAGVDVERRERRPALHPGFAPVGYIVPTGVLIVPPGAALAGYGFDLIVAPAIVQRDHKRWLEDVLLTRLLPNGKLILVDEVLRPGWATSRPCLLAP